MNIKINNMENIRTIKNFRIAKSLVGKNLTIFVEDQNFYYDHDEAFLCAHVSDNAEDRTHNVDRATTYTQTKGYPEFAQFAIVDLNKDLV